MRLDRAQCVASEESADCARDRIVVDGEDETCITPQRGERIEDAGVHGVSTRTSKINGRQCALYGTPDCKKTESVGCRTFFKLKSKIHTSAYCRVGMTYPFGPPTMFLIVFVCRIMQLYSDNRDLSQNTTRIRLTKSSPRA